MHAPRDPDRPSSPGGIERTVDADTRRVYILVQGALSDAIVDGYFARFADAARELPDFDRVLDLSAADATMSMRLVQRAAQAMEKGIEQFVGRYAIVAPRDDVFEAARGFASLVFWNNDRCRVFRTRTGADAWLSLKKR